MLVKLRPHTSQFLLYLVSGGAAFVADFGSYSLLLELGVWYIAASVIGSILGFITAFLGHKYVVFKKKERFVQHLTKYTIVDVVNTALATGLLYLLVENGGIGEEWAKLGCMAAVVLWNFLLLKFVVYI